MLDKGLHMDEVKIVWNRVVSNFFLVHCSVLLLPK